LLGAYRASIQVSFLRHIGTGPVDLVAVELVSIDETIENNR